MNSADTVKPSVPKSRTTYIVLAFFFGSFGVHNYYAGYFGRGLLQLTVFVLLHVNQIPLYFLVSAWAFYDICTVKKDSKGMAFKPADWFGP
ncbi:MAG: TM2 domain-containing protein [Azonexus sp.]|jgi:TM2 domain-containing membrane protein YozV|uniref:TM2 domain-containing protein n=1 Tax=Azonexus sp. TaxID=1872668 RepID=UPI00282AFA23|nr:TM2 domain-containing protein [Azonexus sp.]MDR0776857.1 TM2 domain-containing protein [Azonexus sp.]